MQPTKEPALAAPHALEVVRGRVEQALRTFLAAQRRELSGIAAEAVALADELTRLVEAGGKRLRPAFCFWGYLAAGGEDDERIIRAAAALELFHTFALIHDDLMDRTAERRGARTSRPHLQALAEQAGSPADADRFGLSAAILAGDLAAVWVDGAELPMLAPVAMQEGRYAARSIMAEVKGAGLPSPFRYRDRGVMAVIGRNAAVAAVGPLRFTGALGWLIWLVVHLYYLIGFRNRAVVLLNWGWNYLRKDRPIQMITHVDPDPLADDLASWLPRARRRSSYERGDPGQVDQPPGCQQRPTRRRWRREREAQLRRANRLREREPVIAERAPAAADG